MPSLPIYCAKDDLGLLLGLVADCAAVVGDGPGRWRAVQGHVPADGSVTALWFPAGGALPLPGAVYEKTGGVADARPTGVVEDPFAGWQEARAGADPARPWLGPGDSMVFWLSLRIAPREAGSACGMTTIGWSGTGGPDGARRATVNRWAKLKRDLAKRAVKVPRGGMAGPGAPEIWAFPAAQAGLDRADVNPAVG